MSCAAGALLDGLADVGVDERRAVLAELERRRRARSAMGPICSARCDVEVARGRFLEERSGPGRAGLVHGVVDGHAVVQQDVLGVLPADLEDGVDLGLEVGGAHRVGDDLVVDAGRLQEHAEQLARRAGGGASG